MLFGLSLLFGQSEEATATNARLAERIVAPSNELANVNQTLKRAVIVRSQRWLDDRFTVAGVPRGLEILELKNVVDFLQCLDHYPLC